MLDIRKLRRSGYLRRDALVEAAVRWESQGAASGAVRIRVDLQPGQENLTISYKRGDRLHEERVAIVSSPCRFGGERFYFLCPRLSQRCEVLISCGGSFLSRQANQLSYTSQSRDQLGRLQLARRKAEERAFGRRNLPKPRGARKARLVGRWIDLESRADELFEAEAARRFGSDWKVTL